MLEAQRHMQTLLIWLYLGRRSVCTPPKDTSSGHSPILTKVYSVRGQNMEFLTVKASPLCVDTCSNDPNIQTLQNFTTNEPRLKK